MTTTNQPSDAAKRIWQEAYEASVFAACEESFAAADTAAALVIDRHLTPSEPVGCGLVGVGASYRRDLDAWVIYKNHGERIGQLDGWESRDLLEPVCASLRRATPPAPANSDASAAYAKLEAEAEIGPMTKREVFLAGWYARDPIAELSLPYELKALSGDDVVSDAGLVEELSRSLRDIDSYGPGGLLYIAKQPDAEHYTSLFRRCLAALSAIPTPAVNAELVEAFIEDLRWRERQARTNDIAFDLTAANIYANIAEEAAKLLGAKGDGNA